MVLFARDERGEGEGMTDRFLTVTVVLEKETREDDAEPILNAIRMIKGVLSAKGNVLDLTQYAAMTHARYELGEKLIDVVYPDRKKGR